MCGIAGFYSLNGDMDMQTRNAAGQEMANALAHRGPDAGGVWCDPQAFVVLAHRRLSIIDLSDAGAQPMASASGRYVVTFNGEIYNFLELQKKLVDLGAVFKSHSDTEVILAAIEQWGFDSTVQQLNGMFAFVVWDRKNHVLHFARDRFGKKPLYIGWVGDKLVFASELKAIATLDDFKKEISEEGLSLYMRYGYLCAPHSIYKNIYQMMPASLMTLSLEDLKSDENLADKMKTYWSLKEVTEVGKSNLLVKPEAEIIDEFEEELARAVSSRMISDVPLGAFLSGGIDSSTVVALMQKQASAPVKTFSIGFEEEEFNEAQYAKKIAAYLKTDHHEFYVSGQDALNVIPMLPSIYDEPFSDQSQIPTYLISKLAREHVTVALTGDGGDEILGGYDRHTKIASLWNKVGWMPTPLRNVLFGTAGSLCPNNLSKVKRALSLMKLENADAVYEALVRSWQEDVTISNDVSMHHDWPTGLNFSEKMMFGDLTSYRPNDLMVKTDRASMAVALEARAPLMDYQLSEYCWRVPHHMKVRGGKGKWLLRQVLKRHVPESLFERPKMGFSIPLAAWLRGDLKEWGHDLIYRNHPMLKNEIIQTRWNDFQKSNSNQVPKDLWTALMFYAWVQRWK